MAGAKWYPLKGEALIDKLIACWSDWDSNEEYYLSVLAPNIVHSDGRADGFRQLRGNEREIVVALRQQLSEEEIVEEMQVLELEDVRTSLRFASRRPDRPVVAARSSG